MTATTETGSAGSTKAPATREFADRGWLLALLYGSLFIVAIYPIWSVTIPPLVDYPNNLARIQILAAGEKSAALRSNYDVNWAIRPNLAIDLLVTPLAHVMPLYDAGRIFVSLTLLALLGGTLALRRVVVGRIGLWPVLTFLVLYNYAFYWGFLNFLLTAGISMVAFAAWIAMRDRPKRVRFAIFSCVAFLLFLGHLIAFLIYGLAIFGYELWRHFRNANPEANFYASWATALGQFVVPSILFLHWAHVNRSTDNAITRYGDLYEKLVAVISPVHFAVPEMDWLLVLFLGCVLVWCRRQSSLRFAPELKLPTLFVLGAAVLIPHHLSDVWGTDFRLPTIVVCMVIAAISFQRTDAKAERLIAGIAIVLFVAKISLVSYAWRDIDAKFDEFRQALVAMPEGASLLVVSEYSDLPAGEPYLYGALYWHIGALAVIERSAFYPTLFTGHTTVSASVRRQSIDSPSGTPLSRGVLAGSANPINVDYKLGHELSRYLRIFWIGWPDTFDYVLLVRFGNHKNPYPKRLKRVFEGSYFDLYRVSTDTAAQELPTGATEIRSKQ